MVAKTVRQIALRPGTYNVHGQPYRLNPTDLRRIATATRALLKTGRAVPVLLEHAEPGSAEGAPQKMRDLRARRVKNAEGWLTDISQEPDGSLAYEMEIPDPEIAARIRDGRIRFTSPEFREHWADPETGDEFRDIVSHVALTVHPRAKSQGPLEFDSAAEAEPASVLQFSLMDYLEPSPMTRKTKTARRNATPATNGNASGRPSKSTRTKLLAKLAQFAEGEESAEGDGADAGDESDGVLDAAEIKAVCDLLKRYGITLPEDTAADNFLANLKAAITALAGADAEAAGESMVDNATEETAYRQFSIADVRAKKAGVDKLLGRVIGQAADAYESKISALAGAHSITPAVAEKLRNQFPAVQFSADGDEAPAFTLADVLGLLEANTKAAAKFAGAQFSSAAEADAPGGRFSRGDDWQGPQPGSDEHKAIVSRQLGRAAK